MPLGKYPPFTLEFYLLIPQLGESASTLLRKVTGRGSQKLMKNFLIQP